MEATDEKRIGDYLIKIFPDESAESPNEWGDEERFLVFDHRDFYVQRDGFDPKDIFEDGEKVKGYHVFRCYAYIHSGVALSVGSHSFPDARWDVSFKGFWLIKREKGTWTRAQALKAATDLCDTWNQYLSGDVYGYEISKVLSVDEDGNPDELEELDSVWGYYGESECLKEAESIVEYYQTQNKNEQSEVPAGSNSN